jgi:hypothetical protein
MRNEISYISTLRRYTQYIPPEIYEYGEVVQGPGGQVSRCWWPNFFTVATTQKCYGSQALDEDESENSEAIFIDFVISQSRRIFKLGETRPLASSHNSAGIHFQLFFTEKRLFCSKSH